MRFPVALAPLAFAAVLASAEPPAEPERPQFATGIEQVVVDAVVLDAAGKPVAGLGRDDFALLEDGVAQTLASFEAFALGAPSAPSPADTIVPAPGAPVSPQRAGGRVFALVFDDLGLTRPQGERAKEALRELVRRAAEPDLLLLLATSGKERWTARTPEDRADLLAVLDRLQGTRVREMGLDQVTEAEAYRIEVQRDRRTLRSVLDRIANAGMFPTVSAQIVEGMVKENAAASYRRAARRVESVLGAVEEAVVSAGNARGRKAVVLASSGFFYEPSSPHYRRLVEACRRANATVNLLDPAGLEAMPLALTAQSASPVTIPDANRPLSESQANYGGVMSDDFAQDRGERAGALVVANDTGGIVATDLASGLARLEQESRVYYLLGYVPTNAARDGRFRKITVQLAPGPRPEGRRGWQVRARRGYVAEAAAREPEAGRTERALLRALDSASEQAELPVRLAAFVLEDSQEKQDRVRCRLLAEVDLAAVPFREQKGRAVARLDAAFETRPRDGGRLERSTQQADLRLLPGTRQRLLRDGYLLESELPLAAGVHQARLAVREEASGRTGTATVRFEVPPAGSFRRSTPVLSDRSETDREGWPHPVPAVRREFEAGHPLYLAFDVHGAALDPKTRQPRVTMGYDVVGPDGSVALAVKPVPITPNAEGRLHRYLGFELGRAAVGEYRVVSRIRDEVAGRQIQASDVFRVRSRPEREPETEASAGGDPELEALLRRAGEYVLGYERAFRDIVAEEDYDQRSASSDGGLGWRHTRADLVFVRFPDRPIPWVSFRDVFELNGRPVRVRDGRLEALFRNDPAHARDRAAAILAEGAHYNIGAERNVNLPTLALLFLHPANQPRFRFERQGRPDSDSVEIAFREITRPTLVRDRSPGDRGKGGDLPAEGRFWIEPRSGAVQKTETRFRFQAYEDRATITTVYRLLPRFSIWLPAEMRERYEGEMTFRRVSEATARYSNFRRFRVEVIEGGARVKER